MTVNELTGLSREEMHRQLVTEYGAYVRTIVHNRLRSCGNSHDIEECVCDVLRNFSSLPKRGVSAEMYASSPLLWLNAGLLISSAG